MFRTCAAAGYNMMGGYASEIGWLTMFLFWIVLGLCIVALIKYISQK